MYSQRNASFVIGMAGADQGYGESVCFVAFEQILFNLNLLSRILPIRICKRRSLCDHIILNGFMIGRCRRDKEKLLRFTLKHPEISLCLFFVETDKIANRIEIRCTFICRNLSDGLVQSVRIAFGDQKCVNLGSQFFFVVYIANMDFIDFSRKCAVSVSAVYKCYFITAFHEASRNRLRNGSRTSDK